MKKKNEEGLFRQTRQKILLIMKLTTAFLLMSFLSVSAETIAQRTTIKVSNASLKSVFKEIKQKMGYTFIYNEGDVNKVGKVTLDVTSDDVKYILDKCLNNTLLGYYIQDDVIVIQTRVEQIMREAEKESFRITGIVKDKKEEALPGVTILIKGTSIGTATGADGKFSMEVPKMDSVVLVFSFVGMKNTVVVLKDLKKDMKPLTVVMEEDKEELSEIVVTGMFNRRKEGFTGSALSVKGDDLKKISTTNIAKALAAIDPSFRIMEDVLNGSNPNRLPDLRMRGQATLPGGSNAGASAEMVTLQGEYDTYPNKPLLIMDGFEIDLQTMVDLDPDRVESITLLKDAAATAIYGSRAANGVIVIESKTPKEGRLWVSYGGNLRIEIPDLSDYNLMNAEEKLEYEKRAGLFNPLSASDMNYYNHYKQEILRGVDTYWLSKPLQTPITHRHTLSMEGGDEALRDSLSGNYSSEPGVMKESDRTSMGLSLSLQYRRKKWNINNQLSLSNVKGNNSPYGSFSEYTKLNPYYRVKDENGNYTKLIEYKSMGAGTQREEITNPLYNIQFPYKDMTENFSVTDNFAIECAIQENLRVNVAASFTKGTARSEVFKSMNHTDFAGEKDLTKKGSYRKNTGETFTWSLNASVNYNLTFGKHLISLFGRWNVDENQGNSVNLSAKGFPNDNMTDFLFGFEMDNRVAGMESTSRSVGVIGQVLECLCTHSCHNVHVEYNIDRVCQLNTNLSDR